MGKLFGYYKLECNDLDVIRETLTKEQGFDLICALVDYSRDSTITELPAELRIPFAMLKKKVDQAHKVYEDKCNTLKENGRKGGEAKAKNREQVTGLAPERAKNFRPPTLSQFKNAVKRIADNNDFDDVDSYDIEAFFDSLKEEKWNLNGMTIQSRNDWEEIIYARFHDPLSHEYNGLYIRYYEFFCYLVSAYPQLHHRWTDVSEILCTLLECWKNGYWDVDSNTFERSEWKMVLDNLAAKWIEEMPP